MSDANIPTNQEAEKLSEVQAAAEKEKQTLEEKKKDVLMRAAKIVEIMETEGYKEIIYFITEEQKAYDLKMRDVIVASPQTGTMAVDEVKVAYYAGCWEMMDALLKGLGGMKSMIEKEAEKNAVNVMRT